MPSGSWYVRGFALSPAPFSQNYRMQYLVSGGEKSNDTAIFTRNETTGMLTEVARLTVPDQPFSTYYWL